MYYVNGQWFKENVSVIHPEDRGYQFGDGVYEVIRVYGGRLFQQEEHLARLERSAREIRMTLPWSRQELSGILDEVLEKNGVGCDDAILYIQITRGPASRQHEFPSETHPVLSANLKKKPRPLEQQANGVAAVTQPDIRWLRCDIKSLNLLGAVLAKQAAKDAGAFEAILHRDGIVTEGSATNVFAVKDGALHTHPANQFILHGITRQTVINLAKEIGLTVVEQPFDLNFLRQADNIFLTGTTSEIMPVVKLDGNPVGDGQVAREVRQLQQAFEHLVAQTASSPSR